MITETKTLEAIMHCALQKEHAGIPAQEIATALSTLNHALKTVHVAARRPSDVITNLRYASNVLSGLLYVISNNELPVEGSKSRLLIKDITGLHTKVNACIAEYANVGLSPCPLLPVRNLLRTLISINQTLKLNTAIAALYSFLQEDIETIISTKIIHYHRWLWWSQFASLYETSVQGLASFCDLLVKLNFNKALFINWLSADLVQEIDTAPTLAGKLAICSNAFSKYDGCKPSSYRYMPAENSVRRAMLIFLKKQLFCLTKMPVAEQLASINSVAKLNTALSVPQLALLARLMVETKILNENNLSALLKNIATVISTSKATAVSPESLRVNYYTPGHAAKSIVKEYLLNMMNLLRSY